MCLDNGSADREPNAHTIVIRKSRMALKISQEAFADPIAMYRAYYSAIERGKRNLTLGTLHRVAKGLGVRMADLLRDCNI